MRHSRVGSMAIGSEQCIRSEACLNTSTSSPWTQMALSGCCGSSSSLRATPHGWWSWSTARTCPSRKMRLGWLGRAGRSGAVWSKETVRQYVKEGYKNQGGTAAFQPKQAILEGCFDSLRSKQPGAVNAARRPTVARTRHLQHEFPNKGELSRSNAERHSFSQKSTRDDQTLRNFSSAAPLPVFVWRVQANRPAPHRNIHIDIYIYIYMYTYVFFFSADVYTHVSSEGTPFPLKEATFHSPHPDFGTSV